jgi:hypothetical protein
MHGEIVGPQRIRMIDDEALVVVDDEEGQEAKHAEEDVLGAEMPNGAVWS